MIAQSIHVGRDEVDGVKAVLLLVSPALDRQQAFGQAVIKSALMRKTLPQVVFRQYFLVQITGIRTVGENADQFLYPRGTDEICLCAAERTVTTASARRGTTTRQTETCRRRSTMWLPRNPAPPV